MKFAPAFIEHIIQDLRFAFRVLRRSPAFTALAIAALALGIGSSSAMFSVVHSVLLRPLPFPHSDSLVMVWERQPSGRTNVVQTQNFLDWRARNRSFTGIAALLQLPMNLEGQGEPIQIPGLSVTAGFFEILGVPPQLGRGIGVKNERPGGADVAVLSQGLWKRRFGGRPDIVGSKIVVNGAITEVIGVMPAGFRFPTIPRADVFVPARLNLANAPRDGRNYTTIARLKPGISLRDAQADMRTVAEQTAIERPDRNKNWSATVIPLIEQTTGNSRTMLLVLLGAVGFVLLIACANVANLLLMRASARRREMSVRIALGAGRWRLVQQLIVESLLLAVCGGLAGFLLAEWSVPLIVRMLPASFPLPRLNEITVDSTVLFFSLAVSLGCGILFGIVPAFRAEREEVSGQLRQGGRSGSAGNRAVRNALVVAEVALAMLLVVGAGLMLRSFLLLNSENPGFQPDHLLTFTMRLTTLGGSFDQTMARRSSASQRMLELVRQAPGVKSAGTIHLLPLSGQQSGTGFHRVDGDQQQAASGGGGDVSVISAGYFATMGIPMAEGRDFDDRDRLGSPDAAILNRTAAQRIFGNENPLGKRLSIFWGRAPYEAEVVGVSADIRHNGLDKPPAPTVFLPQSQQPSPFVSLVVRTSGDPATAIATVKQRIYAADPSQGIQDIQTMRDAIAGSIARPRLEATILTIFGVMSLVLACVGIYAVISYSVQQRTREMGIRLALGAPPKGIVAMVLREGLWMAGSGIVIGLLGALALTRYLSTLLYQIHPTDAPVYIAVSAILGTAALAGSYIPARRATRIDPAIVLREE